MFYRMYEDIDKHASASTRDGRMYSMMKLCITATNRGIWHSSQAGYRQKSPDGGDRPDQTRPGSPTSLVSILLPGARVGRRMPIFPSPCIPEAFPRRLILFMGRAGWVFFCLTVHSGPLFCSADRQGEGLRYANEFGGIWEPWKQIIFFFLACLSRAEGFCWLEGCWVLVGGFDVCHGRSYSLLG